MNVLDNPVWHGLVSRQAAFAQGEGLARRFDPTIAVFGAARDLSRESINALGAIVPENGAVALLQRDQVPTPDGCDGADMGGGYQMVLTAPERLLPPIEFVELGEADFPTMLELATLTRPGPFLLGTPRIGGYIGVRREGRLAAMAGERFKPPGFTEISAVCTHPVFRGQGLAGALSSVAARRIIAQGEIPILHVFAQNTSAIVLYEKLGFEKRCEVHVKRLTRTK